MEVLTTIPHLYDKLDADFISCCFQKNVRGISYRSGLQFE